MNSIEFNNRTDQFNNLFFGYAMRLTGNKENAKDLMQETMMRAFANRNKFIEGSNFKAWVNTIMRNCFINEYRKKRTRNEVEQPIEDNAIAAAKHPIRNLAPTIMMMKELRTMMDNLSNEQLIPFEMFFNGYEYREIAQHLGLPMGTIKSRIFFARKKLRDMISSQYGEQIRYA